MPNSFKTLLEQNKHWVLEKLHEDEEFFHKLAATQHPSYLWIGCSDSRVAANQITGSNPGEIFVHRNIANLVVHTDINMLSVLYYAVRVLKVKHVIVCGHYNCGGIKAALGNESHGIIDNWLLNIKDVYRLHQAELETYTNIDEKANRLTELNVIEQVYNLAKTSVIQEMWANGDFPILHGWVYDINDGIIRSLDTTIRGSENLPDIYNYSI
jgi:carbonic anhydrase